jgi:hypothetical protein
MQKYNFQKKSSKRNQNDETLPNFTRKKHPRKGEKKETKGKDQSPKQANSLPQGGIGTIKYLNLHQSHEAYQLKKGGGGPSSYYTTITNLKFPGPAAVWPT